MADYKTENYKKAVEKALERWADKVDKLAKELAAIADELDELEALEEPSSDDEKQIEVLKKKRAEVRKKMETAATELRLDLMLLEVPPDADEKELAKIPPWLKEIIKKKGIPLGKYVTMVPNIELDFKKKKLKSFGLTLKWEF